MKKLLYILTFFITATGFAQSSPLFEQGKERYKEGKYQEAIENWMKILDGGEHSANLYFNLANANYKLNNVGPSIYYYEKALQLDPTDNDIQTNLAFAENARIDDIEPLPRTIFSKWHAMVSGLFSINGWATTAVSCSMVFVLLFLLYYFAFSERRKRLLFASSMIFLGLLLASLAMAFQVHGESQNDKPAIIFAESTEVKSEPSMGSDAAFVLNEGTKVQILDIDDNWVRIQIIDGKDGWIPTTDLKQL